MLISGRIFTRKRGMFRVLLNDDRWTHSVSKPISWSWGQAVPTINENSWTNLSSVLWVEQPVGTGYSQGVPNIKVGDYG